MKNKTLFLAATCAASSLLATSAVSAANVVFSTFNPLATGNTANVGGSMTNLTVTRAGAGTVADNFIYTFTYSNQSFDGDGTLDTLKFDIRVTGFNGGTITNGSASGTNSTVFSDGTAIIGTTQQLVQQTTKGAGASGTKTDLPTWTVGNGNMDINESLSFTLENFSVMTSTGTYGAATVGFSGFEMWENGGNTHQTVIGAGTGLFAKTWSNNGGTASRIPGSYNQPTLYVSEGPNTTPSGYNNWGLASFNFTVDVDLIPEPSSVTLLGLGLAALALRRRR
ncbi:MAG: PEP-CTERM sorting domain-containing protein [Akkermansiaceae bacterium]|nr:PEP-CTERM sorting domain-containing protein [Akkermansiaceae bacterium]